MAIQEDNTVVKSYNFFIEKEKKGEGFTITDLVEATGWSKSTVKTYLSKKWDSIIEKRDDKFYVINVSRFSKVEYEKMMSQNNRASQDPFKPELDEDTERLVVKARDSALLALDIYNRPATIFKTEGFIIMMIIAWTSLFHAVFQNRGVKYIYTDKEGNDKIIDGDLKAWEISMCANEFYKAENNAIRKNIEFMIGLRNKIEHRFAPKIDNHVGGECQALLLNFDELLIQEFGDYYALKDLLIFPLQTTSLRNVGRLEVVKKFQGKQYDEIKEYIDAYRESITDETYSDPKFSFRVFLMPKVGNRKSSSDLAMEFIPYDVSNKDDMESLKKHVTLIKEKNIQVANQGMYKPSAVVDLVKVKIEKPFNLNKHVQAYKYYKVRDDAKSCKVEYCQYDEPHKDFIYTQKWIDFLVEKLSNEDEYQKVVSYKPAKHESVK